MKGRRAEGINVLCTVVEYSSRLAMQKAVIRRRRGSQPAYLDGRNESKD
jgi:hypothetical protein